MKIWTKNSLRKGFTLVELLVTMVIAMIIIAGIYQIFTTQQRSYSIQGETAKMQQRARTAEEFLTKSIQQTGGFLPTVTGETIMFGSALIAASDNYIVMQFDDPYDTNSPGYVSNDEVVAFVLSKGIVGTNGHIVEAPAVGGGVPTGIAPTVFWDSNGDLASDEVDALDFDIELDRSGPPYNLYMVTPINGTSSNYELVTSNVDNLILRYLDADGQPIYTDADLPYQLDVDEIARVRSIQMEIVLRTDSPDARYSEDFKIPSNSVGTYTAGGVAQPGSGTDGFLLGTDAPTTDDDKLHRRRLYLTTITPRHRGVDRCGTIVLTGDDPVPCPTSSVLTATVLDGSDNVIATETTVTFEILGTYPTAPSFSDTAVLSSIPDGTAGGVATATLYYTGTETSVSVRATAVDVDCTDGEQKDVSAVFTVDFVPGIPTKALVTLGASSTENDPALDPVYDVDDPTTLGFLPTCGTAVYIFNAGAYDECNNLVPPNTNPPAPGNRLEFEVVQTVAGTSVADLTDDEFLDASGEIFTASLTGIDFGPQDIDDGYFDTQLRAANHPVWVTEGIYLTQNDLENLTNNMAASGVAPYFLYDVNTKPWPPNSISMLTNTIDDTFSPDWPNCLDALKMDYFAVLDCKDIRIYQLNEATDSHKVRANLSEDALVAPDASAISSTSGGSSDSSIDITDSGGDGAYDISYEILQCEVNDPPFSDDNPSTPDITLSILDNLDALIGSPVTLTPEITPCYDCLVKVGTLDDPNTEVETITTCEGAATVTVGTCGAEYVMLEYEISSSYVNGLPPQWEDISLDPTVTAQQTLVSTAGGTSFNLLMNDAMEGAEITIWVYDVDPDTMQVASAPSCTTSVKIENLCSGFRTWYTNADLDEVDIYESNNICAASVGALFFELQHCKNVASPLARKMVVEVYTKSGERFDSELVTLSPDLSGETPPYTVFNNRNDGLPLKVSPLAFGTEKDVLEFPKGARSYIKVKAWEDPLSTTGWKCPPNDFIFNLAPPLPLCFPNAITSGGGADWNGNFKIHWGDAVIRGRVDTPADNKRIYKGTENSVQFDGKPFLAKNSDRFFDLYVGKALDGRTGDGNIIDNADLPIGGTYDGVRRPFLDDGFGNYFTNISNEKISEMIVTLNYDLMKELALDHSPNAYWFTIPKTMEVYNPTTGVLLPSIEALVDDPVNNPNNDGDFLFIDTWGVTTDGGATYTIPSKTDAQINADAGGDRLPIHKLSGNAHTEGIIYIAGSLEFTGGGALTTIPADTPPHYDVGYDIDLDGQPITDSSIYKSTNTYDHNRPFPEYDQFTEDELPIRPIPNLDLQREFNLGVHVNGAIYVDGDFGGSGSPSIYGALTAEGGYSSAGTPEIWYNYNLNVSGVLNSLCVECCSLTSEPAALSLVIGETAILTPQDEDGEFTIEWDSSHPHIADVDDNGEVTAYGEGNTTIWLADENNCTFAVPVHVDPKCAKAEIKPDIVPDPATGETFDIANGAKPWTTISIVDADPLASWSWAIEPVGSPVASFLVVSNGDTVTVQGDNCGSATVIATDDNNLCTGTYESLVTVGNGMTAQIDPALAAYPSNTPITITLTDVNSGTLNWDVTPSGSGATVKFTTSSMATVTFLNPGIWTLTFSDKFNCDLTLPPFYVDCAAPTVEMITPLDGEVYGVLTTTEFIWQAEPNDNDGVDTAYDKIAYVEFTVTPDPGVLPENPHREFIPQYCGFGGADCALEGVGDVSAWPDGEYTLTAEVFTDNYGCGVLTATDSVTITVKNCLLTFTDDFSSDPISADWLATCVGSDCSPLNSLTTAAGELRMYAINGKKSTAATYYATTGATTPIYAPTDDFVTTVKVASISNPQFSLEVDAGLVVTDAAGELSRYVTLKAGDGLNNTGIVLEYNNGAGAQVAVALAAAQTTLTPPYWLRIDKVGNQFTAYTADTEGVWVQYADAVTVDLANPIFPGLRGTVPSEESQSMEIFFDDFTTDCYTP